MQFIIFRRINSLLWTSISNKKTGLSSEWMNSFTLNINTNPQFLQISSDSQIYVMIRCKSGSDFCYTENDLNVMLSDVDILKTIGIDGFVFGALDHEGKIDEDKCKQIIAAANPLPITFHRAFDVCSLPPNEALEKIVSLGFKRILTSGKQNSAENDEALALIKNLTSLSRNRIIIMPGSGINDKNVKKVLKTGVREVHASCLVKKSNHQHKMSMGKNSDDQYYLDKERVEKIVSILNDFN